MRTALILAVVIAVCVAPVWAQGRGPGGPPRGGGMAVQPPPPADMIDRISTALGLTTDQATALKAVLTANDQKIQPPMKAAGDAGKALRDAFVAADFDSAAELAVAANDAQLAVTKASITAWADIKASGILTTDQFTKLLAGPGGPPPGPGNGPGGNDSSSSRRR